MFKEQTMSNQSKGMTLVMTSILLALGIVGGIENAADLDFGLTMSYFGLVLLSIATGLLGLSYLEA
jgi:hypothetical protein